MATNLNTKIDAADNAAPIAKNAGGETPAINAGNKKDDQSSMQAIKQTASGAAGQVKEKAASVLEDQKGKVTSSLNNVADSIRKVGENLRGAEDQNPVLQTTARYGDSLAEKLQGVSDYLEHAKLKDLTRDLEGFARQQPALFIGGAFLVGILAARFLKTSAPAGTSNRHAAKSGNSAGSDAASRTI